MKGGQKVLNNVVQSMLPTPNCRVLFQSGVRAGQHLDNCDVRKNVIDDTGASVVIDMHV